MKVSPDSRKKLRFQRNIISAALNGRVIEFWNGEEWTTWLNDQFDFQSVDYRVSEPTSQRISLDGKEYEIRLLLKQPQKPSDKQLLMPWRTRDEPLS